MVSLNQILEKEVDMETETKQTILEFLADLEGDGVQLGRYNMFNDDGSPSCIAGYAYKDHLHGKFWGDGVGVWVAGQVLMDVFDLSETEAEELVQANDDASYETPELGIKAWLGGIS